MAKAGSIRVYNDGGRVIVELQGSDANGPMKPVELALEDEDEVSIDVILDRMKVNIDHPRIGLLDKSKLKVDVRGPFVRFEAAKKAGREP